MASQVQGWEVRGSAELEARYFPEESPFVEWQGNVSGAASLEVLHDWNSGKDLFAFVPFGRIDQHDSQRTHLDIRELSWIHVGEGWESRVGIRKVFWGVTEGRHLVDIINQTDLVDQIDEEEKLGQPMLNLSMFGTWGTFDLYVLPGFRERTFAGKNGRPRLPIPVDGENALYESSAADERVDVAARWQFHIEDWQIALSHFSGTGREPTYLSNISMQEASALLATGSFPIGFEPKLIPLYSVIDQTGLELQFLHGGWLWKLEAISRSGQGDRFFAADGGFEYTQSGLFGGVLDIGWIIEYLWESREAMAASPLEHDWLFGARFALNDTASSEMLVGLLYDPHTNERVLNVESSRRLSDSIKVALDVRVFMSAGQPPSPEDLIRDLIRQKAPMKPLSPYAKDDLIQLSIAHYF